MFGWLNNLKWLLVDFIMDLSGPDLPLTDCAVCFVSVPLNEFSRGQAAAETLLSARTRYLINRALGRVEYHGWRIAPVAEIQHTRDGAGDIVESAGADTLTAQPVVLDKLEDGG